MEEKEPKKDLRLPLNYDYPCFQLEKALRAAKEKTTPEKQKKAEERVLAWESVIRNFISGKADYGSNQPFKEFPKWVSLNVPHGGFADGSTLAGGPLTSEEKELIAKLYDRLSSKDRLGLNLFFLSDLGLEILSSASQQKNNSSFLTSSPEESALLIIEWLLRNDHVEQAGEIISQIAPYFDRLRFFPLFTTVPVKRGLKIHRQSVRRTIEDLNQVKTNMRVAAQKEAVSVWLPFHDKVTAHFSKYPENCHADDSSYIKWIETGKIILSEYRLLAKKNRLCSKHKRQNSYQYQLRALLTKLVEGIPLSHSEKHRVQHILKTYIAKRGNPNSKLCLGQRDQQCREVSAPQYAALSKVIIARLKKVRPDFGIDFIAPYKHWVKEEESKQFDIPEKTRIPDKLTRIVSRCLNGTIDGLFVAGVIPSGEVLAPLLSKASATIHASSFPDPELQALYASAYQAFRRRRSLLLLNLNSQVRFEDLPWIRTISQFRTNSTHEAENAKAFLKDSVLTFFRHFPQTIVPNKLLKEFSALAKSANLDLELTEEVAADIFCHQFSDKYFRAAINTAGFLKNTLYSDYYNLQHERLTALIHQNFKSVATGFYNICAERAGHVKGKFRHTAYNGTILEQQQILTSHNLAALFESLDLHYSNKWSLSHMATDCFDWLSYRIDFMFRCKCLSLSMIKKCAYAWRQMVFYLSLMSRKEVDGFLRHAERVLSMLRPQSRHKLGEYLAGLDHTLNERHPGKYPIFLGWTTSTHFLQKGDG